MSRLVYLLTLLCNFYFQQFNYKTKLRSFFYQEFSTPDFTRIEVVSSLQILELVSSIIFNQHVESDFGLGNRPPLFTTNGSLVTRVDLDL